MTHLKAIFDVWQGNASALASDIGEQDVKVRQWRARNSIPSKYWQRIIDAAKVKGATLTLAMFLLGFISPSKEGVDLVGDPAGDLVDQDRVVICDVCDQRVDQLTACTFVDCPHSDRRAA